MGIGSTFTVHNIVSIFVVQIGIGAGFFLFAYMCIAIVNPIIRRGNGDQINYFNPVICLGNNKSVQFIISSLTAGDDDICHDIS
jgi:hypothetical protein